MELTYTKHGDYYLPDLTVPEQTYEIGRFGCLHRNYLKQQRPAMYSTLFMSGKLFEYLHQIDTKATELYDQLITQMSADQGITEKLKSQDQMEWVGRMNNIRHSAEEIVLHEIIYN